jgi:hypothetical protein
MALYPSTPTLSPAGQAPYEINREWCLGDSLGYINANSTNFDSRIESLNSNKLNAAGGTVSGGLTITNGLTASGSIRGRYPTPGYQVWWYLPNSNWTSPNQFNPKWTDTITDKIIYSYPSLGDLYYNGTPGTGSSLLFEMKVYASQATTATQYFNAVDDNVYFYLNGSNFYSGTGVKNVAISWSFIQGINLVQVVLNNSGGGPCTLYVYGDFFLRYPNLSFVMP